MSNKIKCPCREYCEYRRPLNVPERLKAMRFEDYTETATNKAALKAARDFINAPNSLYLWGDPGTGKTHLLMSAYYEALTMYCPTRLAYFNIAKLLKIERYEYETREESEERLLSGLAKKKIIFLDDFCAENVSGRTSEILYLLLNDAIENGFPKLFITGNKSLKFITESISDRIASRIAGLCGRNGIIKITGDDMRLRQAEKL